MQRSDWHQLPHGTRDAIQEVIGPVEDAATVSAGLNSALASTLVLQDGSKVFAKGLRNDHRGVVTQEREASIAPYLGEVAPGFLGQVVTAEWNVCLFEHVEADHADYTPGSPDVQHVVDMINTLGKITIPAGLPVKEASQRWSSYIDTDADRALLRGNTLLHTDYNPHNVLISATGTYLIDWAWPTLGAAWIDPACLVVRLIAAGHTAKEAEGWAEQTLVWEDADPRALTIFADASTRMWNEIAEHNPVDWTMTMAEAAQSWRDHRKGS